MEYEESSWGEVPARSSGKARVRDRLLALARRRLPILSWAPRYGREDALADLVAGITLGLTLVPQSIAYAALANLPVQYGLYSSFIGTMLYVFLGTVKEVSIGPTSLMALLVLQTCAGLPVQFVVLLTFLSGATVFAMGLLRLGFLVDLISPSVTSGFTSATAVIIMMAQLKGLLGVSFVAESIPDNLALLYRHRQQLRLGDAALSAACCAALLLLRKLKDVKVGEKRAGLRRALWLLSISRNAIVVCAAAVFAYATYDHANDRHPWIKLSGRVEAGLPPLSVPPFGMSGVNGTVTFVEMSRRLSAGVLMMAVVMVLCNIAIAKTFSGGARVDATQEMLTLGLCNMAGSLVHAMPTCGAFTRSAVSHSSGVRSPLAGLYSGVITLTALAFMTQYFYFLPKACLSSVLICAVMFMIDYAMVVKLWRNDRSELTVLAVTFTVAVLSTVELALLCGALYSLARVLRRLMRPTLHTRTYKTAGGTVVVVRPTLALIYLNAEHVAGKLARAARAVTSHTHTHAHVRGAPLLLDCRDLSLVDHTAKETLERAVAKLAEQDICVVAYNASSEVIRKLGGVRGLCVRTLRTRTPTHALQELTAPSDTPLSPLQLRAQPTDTAASTPAPLTPLLGAPDQPV